MNSYFKAHYQWKCGEDKLAMDTIVTWLSLLVGEDETFSFDEEIFLKDRPPSYWFFVQNLLSNKRRKESFSNVFSKLLDATPLNEVFQYLLTKDFSEPGMCEIFGMDQLGLGFNDPEEDFQLILGALKRAIKSGYLTLSRPKPVICNKIYLDYTFIEEIEESKWKELKPLLITEKKNLENIPEKGWIDMAESDHEFFLSSFLYDYFGSSNREEKENGFILGQCLLSDTEWKTAVQMSAETCMSKLDDTDLNDLIKSTVLITNIKNSKEWVSRLLSFTSNSSETNYKLLLV